MQSRKRLLSLVGMVAIVMMAAPAGAGSHTWWISEVYSKDATGTIEFIESWEFANEAGEVNVQTHFITSLTKSYDIPPPALAPPTNLKFLLFATAGFAALPGAPTPDYIIPDNFFSLLGADTISYSGVAGTSYAAGQLPLNGVNSWNKPPSGGGPNFSAPATPTNYAGATFAPPGTSGLKVAKVPGFPDGSRLQLTWNAGVCLGAAKYQIAYGLGSDLPAALGGTYGLQPSTAAQCAITGSPKIWSGVPDPGADSTRFLWFTILANNGTTTEGSWGQDSAGGERTGPGAGGVSGQCGMTSKNLVNTCQ
jgi:hypothetical protein